MCLRRATAKGVAVRALDPAELVPGQPIDHVRQYSLPAAPGGRSYRISVRRERSIDGTMAKLAADPAALNGPLTTWMPRALFLLLPLYALILALFHIRRRKDYFLVDHLVFSLSVHTFAFVALIVGVILSQVIAGEWVAWLLFAAMSAYIFIAMKRFYAQGWVMTTVKFITVSGLYTIFCLLPAMVCVLLLSVFGGDFV